MHSKFIKESLLTILKDGVNASAGLEKRMETFPINEYLLQSLFLKMTGAQEQKMKCVCWDIATINYEYRYELLNKKKYGECSSYNDKNGIYCDLVNEIEKFNNDFKPSDVIYRQKFADDIKNDITKVFANTNLYTNNQYEFLFFNDNFEHVIGCTQFGGVNLFEDKLKEDYKNFVYKHRNRCAHNTISYQQYYPNIFALNNDDFKYENYFLRFAIILLIDKIFIELYKEFQKNISIIY